MKKAMRIILLVGVILLDFLANSQTPTFEWANSKGGINADRGTSIKVDVSGNVYSTGYFRGTVDFDPGVGVLNLTSAGLDDIFIAKHTSSGNLAWVYRFGASKSDYSYGLTLDGLGNVLIVGRFENSIDFDPGIGVFNLTSSGLADPFILKLTTSGNFVWAKQFTGASTTTQEGWSIASDAGGNIWVGGEFNGTTDFDPGVGVFNLSPVSTHHDIFTVKLSSLGNFSWAASYGLSGDDLCWGLDVDGLGNVYVTGQNEPIWTGEDNLFILKYNGTGTLQWTKIIGASSSGNDVGQSIAADANGNIYVSGYFRNTIDFNPGSGTYNLTSLSIRNVFILKLNTSGNFLWAKVFEGSGLTYDTHIILAPSGNLYITGSFSGTTDFDPGSGTFSLTSAGSQDIFIEKMDASGNFLWAKSIGALGEDVGTGIDVDANGSVYSTGYYTGAVDFNPDAGVNNLTSVGDKDGFVLKLGNCINSSSSINPVACDSYISPSGNYTWTSSNTYMDTIPNTSSCDSIITINLTINNSTNDTDVVTVCDSYLWIDNNTYTSNNSTATHILVNGNSNGCDSVVTLNLTINPLPTVTVGGTATICDGQSTNLTAGGASIYVWDNGAGTGSPVSVSPSTTTTYTVTGTAANSCVNTAQVTITVNPLPIVTVTIATNLLTANNVNSGVTYQWLDCNNNYAIISGEIAQTYAVTVTGNYAVEVTENGCIDTSVCSNIVFVGIDENSFGSLFKVYPNPTSGNVNIALGKVYENLILKVMNVTGQLIDEKMYPSTNEINFNIKGKDGVYLLEIISENQEKSTIKILKH